jgi:hypothetical protein
LDESVLREILYDLEFFVPVSDASWVKPIERKKRVFITKRSCGSLTRNNCAFRH